MVNIVRENWLSDDELCDLDTLRFKRGNPLNRGKLSRSEMDDYFLKV